MRRHILQRRAAYSKRRQRTAGPNFLPLTGMNPKNFGPADWAKFLGISSCVLSWKTVQTCGVAA